MKGHMLKVAPLVGAWIEIGNVYADAPKAAVAPLVGAWIEIIYKIVISHCRYGRSPRGSVD